MTSDLLQQLEQKVAHAVEVIELLRLQLEELEEENLVLKSEHEKWRHDLSNLIKRFDKIDVVSAPPAATLRPKNTTKPLRAEEEDFMTV